LTGKKPNVGGGESKEIKAYVQLEGSSSSITTGQRFSGPSRKRMRRKARPGQRYQRREERRGGEAAGIQNKFSAMNRHSRLLRWMGSMESGGVVEAGERRSKNLVRE